MPRKNEALEKLKKEVLMSIPAFAQKVAPLYVLLQWTWYSLTPEHYGKIPTAGAIEENLKRSLKAITQFGMSMKSGGLQVKASKDELGKYIEISFSVSEVFSAPGDRKDV